MKYISYNTNIKNLVLTKDKNSYCSCKTIDISRLRVCFIREKIISGI